jgi:hypothetical protein
MRKKKCVDSGPRGTSDVTELNCGNFSQIDFGESTPPCSSQLLEGSSCGPKFEVVGLSLNILPVQIEKSV